MSIRTSHGVLFGALAALSLIGSARAEEIKIGEINSYTAMPAFTLPYRKGWQLAVEQVNAAGGVLGRKLEVITATMPASRRTRCASPANWWTSRRSICWPAFLSNVGLAISDFAAQNQAPFVAGEPLTDALVWEKGNRYCFRLRPSTYMQAAMLVERRGETAGQALGDGGAELRIRQLDGEMVQAAAAAKRPDVDSSPSSGPRWARSTPAPRGGAGGGQAGGDVQRHLRRRPDQFCPPGQHARPVRGPGRGCRLLTGEPEYLDPLGDETPMGWMVTGYPGQRRHPDNPPSSPPTGPGSTNTEDGLGGRLRADPGLAGVLARPAAPTPRRWSMPAGAGSTPRSGRSICRAIDHQSTLGTYVGSTALK